MRHARANKTTVPNGPRVGFGESCSRVSTARSWPEVRSGSRPNKRAHHDTKKEAQRTVCTQAAEVLEIKRARCRRDDTPRRAARHTRIQTRAYRHTQHQREQATHITRHQANDARSRRRFSYTVRPQPQEHRAMAATKTKIKMMRVLHRKNNSIKPASEP